MVWLDVKRLKAKDAATRSKAIANLQGCTDLGALEAVAALLADDDPEVRAAASAMLATNAAEDTVRLLLGALGHPSDLAREAAAHALGQRGDPTLCDALEGLLRDEAPLVRAAAAGALRRLGWHPASTQDRALFDVATGNARGAVFSGDAALQPLVRDLKHDTSFVRRAVAEALEKMDDPRAVQPLLEAIADEDPMVRISVIHALSHAPLEQVGPTLLRLLSDPHAKVRLAAAQVLSRQYQAEHIPWFTHLLQDHDFEVRQTAVEFLGKMRDPGQAAYIAPLLTDADADVRRSAAQALGEIGVPECVPCLVVALADEERAVRGAVEAALTKIEPDWIHGEAARSAVGHLEAALQSRPPWVRGAVAHWLGKLQAVPATVPA